LYNEIKHPDSLAMPAQLLMLQSMLFHSRFHLYFGYFKQAESSEHSHPSLQL